MFTSVMVTLFNDILKLIGILAVLYLLNVRLALLMTLFLPLALTVTFVFSRLARDRFRAIRSQLAVLNTFLQEIISAVGVVQLFGRQQENMEKFKTLNSEYLQRTLAQIRLFGTFMPLTEFLSSLAMAAILRYGGGEVIRQQMTLGELTAFLSYMRLFFQPMRELSQKYSIGQSAMASAERIFLLLDTGKTISAPARPLDRNMIKGDIRYEQVAFSYHEQKDEPVLMDINLHIRAGETVALVGPTGAGKSTLISLLVRFYDPSTGRITIGGHDLREFSPRDLREKIGIVLQDVLIEPNTVLTNIVQGTGLQRRDVQSILNRTGMTPFVERLPRGLDTRIGEGGHDLSVGEKQLLAFARVLCRNASIIILDEATSSVDTAMENLLERVLRQDLGNRTCLIIAHRLSTVRNADRIVVLENGRIAEQGTHDELVEKNGCYQQLVVADLG
jgi:ATP-binding cassette subfamily B protein